MSPVRSRQSKLSRKQLQRQKTSPSRGRGRRRTQRGFGLQEATTSTDTVNVSDPAPMKRSNKHHITNDEVQTYLRWQKKPHKIND